MCLTLRQPNTTTTLKTKNGVMIVPTKWCCWCSNDVDHYFGGRLYVSTYMRDRVSVSLAATLVGFSTFWINKKIAHYHHMIKTPILIIVTITTVDDEDDDDDDVDGDDDDDDLSRKNSWRQSIRGCACVFLLLLLVFVWSFVRRFLFVSFRFFSLTELDGIGNCCVMCNVIEPLFSLLLLMPLLPFWGRRCEFGRWDDVHQALGRLDHFTDHRVMFVFVVLLQFVFCVWVFFLSSDGVFAAAADVFYY